MAKEEIYEIIKKRFGTSDEDLNDLGIIMDALDGIDKAETLEQEIANNKLEYEKQLKDLDNKWRDRYRERFFTGDSDITDVIQKMEENDSKGEEAEEITIDDYLGRFDEKGVYHAE
jgi:hypothetical protein